MKRPLFRAHILRRPLYKQLHKVAQRRALRAAERARLWGMTEDEVRVVWANEYDNSLKELKEVHS